MKIKLIKLIVLIIKWIIIIFNDCLILENPSILWFNNHLPPQIDNGHSPYKKGFILQDNSSDKAKQLFIKSINFYFKIR